MNTIKISFLGLGTIGCKLMDYLQKNITNIYVNYGVNLEIEKIFVRDLNKKRSINVSDLCLTTNPYEAIEAADIIIECLGGNGLELTRELILTAIQQKKSIIMSSKKCLATYGQEIVNAIANNNTLFHYDATVGGGIPISSVFDTMGKCEIIQKIYGICNGTSNFILNEMTDTNMSYKDALQKAILNKYAENNPHEDVDGYDALYKSVIMIGFGMNLWIDITQIKPITISNITTIDILKAKEKGCMIKPVFYIERSNEDINVFIGPKYIPNDTLLGTVKKNNNMIVIYGSESHERAFYGQGAGAKPTASAMYDDLIKTIRELANSKVEV